MCVYRGLCWKAGQPRQSLWAFGAVGLDVVEKITVVNQANQGNIEQKTKQKTNKRIKLAWKGKGTTLKKKIQWHSYIFFEIWK
jgi:hypothetical protein